MECEHLQDFLRAQFVHLPLGGFSTVCLSLSYVTQILDHVASILTTADPRLGMPSGDSLNNTNSLYYSLLPAIGPAALSSLCSQRVLFHVSFPTLFSTKIG